MATLAAHDSPTRATSFISESATPDIDLHPRLGYRDYLLGQLLVALDTGGYGDATAQILQDGLSRRMHQDFATTDDDGVPMLPLLIKLLAAALTAPPAEGGFGLAPGQLPAQGQQSNDDYLQALIALSGVDTLALRNRYRVSFSRSAGDSASPVDLNIEALTGVMADAYESPVEPVGALILPSSPELEPIVPEQSVGLAPFFLRFDEWLAEQGPSYPENLFDVDQTVPVFSAEFRTTVGSYPVQPFFHNGFFDGPGELPATKSWLAGLFGVSDALAAALQALADGDLGAAASSLDAADAGLSTAISVVMENTTWILDRFEWSDPSTNVGPVGAEQNISLADRAGMPAATLAQLTAVEAYFAAPELPPFPTDGTPDDADTAKREMELARARSLYVYGILYLRRVTIPALRARLAIALGRYAEALRRLAPLTGYPVGVARPDASAPYSAEVVDQLLYQGDTYPYTIQVTFDAHKSAYRDNVEPIFSGQIVEQFSLPPWERVHYKLQQADAMLTWADSLHRAGGAGAERARELYKGVLLLHLADPQIAAHFNGPLPGPINFGGLNPALAAQINRAQLGARLIDEGLNVYGFADDLVPVLRYRPLKDAADAFAAAAKSTQTEFIGYIEQLEQAEIDEAQAQALVAKADAAVQIAADQVANAQVDVDQAQQQVTAVQAAIASKQQEIADSGSLFNQAVSFLKDGVGDTFTDVLDSTGKLLREQPEAPDTDLDFATLLKSGLDDQNIAADALHNEVGGELGASFDLSESFLSFGVAGYTALASMADEDNRRQSELDRLQNHDLQLAEDVVAVKLRSQEIATLEGQIANADQNFAHWLLTFQQQRFLSRGFWRTVSDLAARQMRRYVDLGARTAWLAERALAFEQDRELQIIRLDYHAPELRDITGADLLLADLAELEAARINGVRLTTPITHTISLARTFPLAFASLKATGQCRFRTTEDQLAVAYPGTYAYRIRTARPSLNTVGSASIRGLLINSGFSTTSGEEPGDVHGLSRFRDALPLSDLSPTADAAAAGLPTDTLVQFEGSGLDTDWEIVLPQAANPLGRAALSDVLLRFTLSASWSATRAAAADDGPASLSLLLAASTFDPAAARALRMGALPSSITFDLRRLPALRTGDRRIANIGLIAMAPAGSAAPVQATVAVGPSQATTQLTDGVALSNAGALAGAQAASTLNVLAGQPTDQVISVGLTAGSDGPASLRDLALYVELEPSDTAAESSSWTLLSPEVSANQPQFDRAGHSAVYAPAAKRMIVFGGFKLGELSLMDDVEVLTDADGSAGDGRWITLVGQGATVGPGPRGSHSAVYDAASDRMVVFGGTTGVQELADDVWVLTGASGQGVAAAWTQLIPAPPGPGPRFGHTAVHRPDGDRMIVFGGGAGDAPLGDVWALDSATGVAGEPTWVALEPQGTGPALWGHSAVYDPDRDVMTVFGGSTSADGGTLSSAVWVLDGAAKPGGAPSWSEIVLDNGPAPRVEHTAVLDAANDAMIVFGGVDATGAAFYDDVWELSGLSTARPRWRQLRPAGRAPVPREAHTAVYDESSRRMTVYGGGSDEGNFFSVWLLG
jgi:hypothetical protein